MALGFCCLYIPLKRNNVILIAVFLFTQLGSLIINDFLTFAVNLKVFLLPLLSLLVFSHFKLKGRLIHIIIILSMVLIILQRFIFSGRFPFEISAYLTTSKNLIDGRPLGIFLNSHISAFFAAAYLMGLSLTLRRGLFLIDFYAVWIHQVATSFFSLVVGKVFFHLTRLKLNKKIYIASFVIVLVISSFSYIYREPLFKALLNFDYIFWAIYHSGVVILKHIVDLDYLYAALCIFPQDTEALIREGGWSEIGLYRLFQQGGLPFSVLFLVMLILNVKMYAFFILSSLIHYSSITTPLIIYIFCFFQHRLNAQTHV